MADNANIRALLMSNAKWAAGVSAADPNRFPNSANNPQKPHFVLLSTLLFTT